MATVFVAGASGYIGSAVAIAFRAAGYRVYGLVRSKEKGADLIRHEVIPVIGDLEDPKTYTEAVERASIIVDTAAVFNAQAKDSVAANRALLNATAASGAKSGIKKTHIYTSGILVHTHSLEVRDETTATKDWDTPFPILQQRLGFENEVLNHTGVRGIILRPGAVYGGPATSVFAGNLLTRYFTFKDKIEILESFKDKRWNWVHITDVAEAFVKAAKRAHIVHGEAFNIVSDSSPTTEQLARACAKVAGFNGPIEYVEKTEDLLAVFGNKTVVLTHDKARDLLDWEPKHNFLLEELDVYYHTIRGSW